jgi:hypothetical protein
MSLRISQPKAQDPLAAIATNTKQFYDMVTTMSQFYHNSELEPLKSIIAHYTAARTLNAVLGPSLAHECETCLQYMGVDMHQPDMPELCQCCFSVACHHAWTHPRETARLARHVLDYMHGAMHTLANLPTNFQSQHASFANFLWKAHQQNPSPCPTESLKQGMTIYNQNSKSWGDWLHVGLPGILHKLQTLPFTIPNEQALKKLIEVEYDRWKDFGKQHLPLVKALATGSPAAAPAIH